MAILFADSMCYASPTMGSPQKWSQVNGSSATIETVDGRFGGRWLKIAGYNTQVIKSHPNLSTIIVQFGYKSLSTSGWVIQFMEAVSGNHQFGILDSSGTWQVWRWGTLLGSSSKPTGGIGVWQQIEIKATIHETNGSVLVKFDGDTVINLTNVNTKAQTNPGTDRVQFGSDWSFGLSDIIIMDTTGSYCNDLLGIRKVKPYVPTGAGTYAQWTPSADANWQCVDEIPPNGDTDYNATSGTGNIDSFDHDDMNVGMVPDAIVCTAYAKTTDAGIGKLKGFVRSNGDEAEGTEATLASAYSFLQSVIYVDPDTSAPFTRAAFNAAEFGYKRSA